MKLEGKVWCFGSNIDTDAIILGRYCHIQDPSELAKHIFEDMSPDFSKNVQKNDIIVAGSNFGCGSSREVAPITIKASGISCVIASSFARIFFRNAINIGLPILESPEASENCKQGDILEIDLANGEIYNKTRSMKFRSAAFPEFLREIISAGGLINYAKKRYLFNQRNTKLTKSN